MRRCFLTVALAACIVFAANGVQYSVSKVNTVDVRIVELEGHKYIVGAYQGINGNGVSLKLLHFEGCNCKSTNVIETIKTEQGPRLFSKKMRLQKYEEQKGICPHCTNHFEFAEMQGDHIVPYSKGGKTEYGNLQMLCAPCNRKKSNKYSY